MLWAIVIAAFLASAVECVEAFTLVLEDILKLREQIEKQGLKRRQLS